MKTKHQLSLTEIHSPKYDLLNRMVYVHLDQGEMIIKKQYGLSLNRLEQIVSNSVLDRVIRLENTCFSI